MSVESLRKRFCKDCGYKINVFSDDFFFNALSKIDGAIEKYDNFEKIVYEKMDGESNFLDYYDKVRNDAIESIKNSEGYKKFNTDNFNKYALTNQYPTKEIYNINNIGKYFISIDMKKANFNSLRHYDASIFNNKKSWEDFLKQFTDENYIIESKNIRQAILGKCNSGRLETYEKYLMDILYKDICTLFNDLALKSFNKDELIFEIKNVEEYENLKDSLEEKLSNFKIPTTVEVFNLAGIEDQKKKIQGYIKEFIDGTYEFKAINGLILNIAQKTYNNEKILDEDLIFENEYGPAKLLSPPKLTIIASIKKNKEIENTKEECL